MPREISRTFEILPETMEQVPLLIGIIGPSFSGKTYSALRLATGMQQVYGGDIWVIDTEGKRASHYKKWFKFQHLHFPPPWGSLDYLAAIRQAHKAGAKVIVTDSMTHEHSGRGGYLDYAEKWLDERAGDNQNKRFKMQGFAYGAASGPRKMLNNAIVHELGINGIFCYRGREKLKFKSGEDPKNIGLRPETTSQLEYDMMIRFLLPTYGRGVPRWAPETAEEKEAIKLPKQFEGWDCFEQGVQLSEDIGRRLAEWAQGDAPKPTKKKKAESIKDRIDAALAHFESLGVASSRVFTHLNIETKDQINETDLASLKAMAVRLQKETVEQVFGPEVQELAETST